jgi:hypothetical protein
VSARADGARGEADFMWSAAMENRSAIVGNRSAPAAIRSLAR